MLFLPARCSQAGNQILRKKNSSHHLYSTKLISLLCSTSISACEHACVWVSSHLPWSAHPFLSSQTRALAHSVRHRLRAPPSASAATRRATAPADDESDLRDPRSIPAYLHNATL